VCVCVCVCRGVSHTPVCAIAIPVGVRKQLPSIILLLVKYGHMRFYNF
jgi:hypothetical protein